MVLADHVCVTPLGDAGESGSNEDNGCESSWLSSEISVSDAKDSKRYYYKRLLDYREH